MGDATVDQVVPRGKWQFDGDVTAAFDDMLSRSIPQYEVMRAACFEVGAGFVKEKTDVVDLGASRGEALAPFVDKFGAHNKFTAVEVSQPMLEVLRERFRGYIDCGVLRVLEADLRKTFPPVAASLILSVLTLQFTPIEHRLRIIADVHRHLVPGGAFVLVEKVLGGTAELDGRFVEIYHDLKRRNGYTGDQIERKRLSLEGVLVPVTARWNEEMLAGFRQVDCFWRWMNFAGWVAVK